MAAKLYKTEAEVYGALRRRFAAPEYATLPGVRDGTGSNSSREIDAIFMSLWPSRGLHINGVEIKVSRSDWLRELKNPKKQESIFSHCDRFWLAVGDPSIIKPGELPETWGLLVPYGAGSLRIKKPAPALEPVPLSHGFLASLLRRADERMRDPEAEERMREELRAEYAEQAEKQVAFAVGRSHQNTVALQTKLEHAEIFEEKAGIRFSEWERLDELAELIKLTNLMARADFMVWIERRLAGVRDDAQALVDQAEVGLEALQKLQAGAEESKP